MAKRYADFAAKQNTKLRLNFLKLHFVWWRPSLEPPYQTHIGSGAGVSGLLRALLHPLSAELPLQLPDRYIHPTSLNRSTLAFRTF